MNLMGMTVFGIYQPIYEPMLKFSKGQIVIGQRRMVLNGKRSGLEEEIEGGKSREQVAQISCECSIPGCFQARLDGALVYWKMSLPVAGELKLLDLYGLSFPIQTIIFHDSIV